MIKKNSFWMIKLAIALCRVSGGILRELDKKSWSWFHDKFI